jgi:murein DD-endopeptidase MepM/ murein hydrolase activator NlpD
MPRQPESAPSSLFQQKPAPARASTPAVHPLIGFLRVNRSVLAITATVFAFATVGIHEMPAQAATDHVVAEAVGMQHIAVPDTVDPVAVTRDSVAVTSFTTVQWPVSPSTPVADHFGPRIAPCASCSSFHQGTDLDAGRGSPIAAIADGVVTQVGNPSGTCGVFAIIQHDIDGVVWSSVYCHMELGSLRLSVGESVKRGQLIGLVGQTGDATGPHLHFGILDASGTAIDSLVWIEQHANVPYVEAS